MRVVLSKLEGKYIYSHNNQIGVLRNYIRNYKMFYFEKLLAILPLIFNKIYHRLLEFDLIMVNVSCF